VRRVWGVNERTPLKDLYVVRQRESLRRTLDEGDEYLEGVFHVLRQVN
jgi:hypothetical protein